MSRSVIRSLAVLVLVGMVAAGCSKPAKQSIGTQTKATTPDVEAPVTSEVPTTLAQQAAAAAKATAKKATTNPGGRITGGGVDDAQARAVGALLKPQSTERRKPYYSGVGENTIQLDFSYDAQSCGVSVVNAVTAAGGALPNSKRFYRAAPRTQGEVTADVQEAIGIMIKYWNDHAFDAADYAPDIRKLMGNDPKNQFFGRHLVGKLIDGGSNQCPDKTTAAAKQAANEDHAFVVFNDGATEGASPIGAYNMAAALNTIPADHRPMHFGTLWLSDQDYTRFAPYAWTQFATGSTLTREYASYVCSKLRGPGAVPARAATVTDPKKRVFGLVHTNDPSHKRLADELKGYLNQYCGGNIIAKEVEYDGTNFSQAQQDDPNLIVQLKLAGVTTVLMLTEPIQPLFQLAAAKGQNWYPEWVFSSFGYSDSSTVQRLYDQDETKGSFGTSNLGVYGGFGFGSGDPFAMYHTYHMTAPDGKPCDPSSESGMSRGDEAGNNKNATVEKYCKAPTALVTWYYTMLPLIGGMLFAGPDLTPQNITAGLQHFPTTRYGGNGPTSDPRPALVGAGTGKYGFVVDAVEWRWRPDFQSPPPEGLNSGGAHWVEYPDCMRHYLTWPDGLAPNWEKSGPNYNSWCGVSKDPYGKAANDYPRTLPDDGNH